jgi:hypothetical protein
VGVVFYVQKQSVSVVFLDGSILLLPEKELMVVRAPLSLGDAHEHDFNRGRLEAYDDVIRHAEGVWNDPNLATRMRTLKSRYA